MCQASAALTPLPCGPLDAAALSAEGEMTLTPHGCFLHHAHNLPASCIQQSYQCINSISPLICACAHVWQPACLICTAVLHQTYRTAHQRLGTPTHPLSLTPCPCPPLCPPLPLTAVAPASPAVMLTPWALDLAAWWARVHAEYQKSGKAHSPPLLSPLPACPIVLLHILPCPAALGPIHTAYSTICTAALHAVSCAMHGTRQYTTRALSPSQLPTSDTMLHPLPFLPHDCSGPIHISRRVSAAPPSPSPPPPPAAARIAAWQAAVSTTCDEAAP
jgi:hypothetical protein